MTNRQPQTEASPQAAATPKQKKEHIKVKQVTANEAGLDNCHAQSFDFYLFAELPCVALQRPLSEPSKPSGGLKTRACQLTVFPLPPEMRRVTGAKVQQHTDGSLGWLLLRQENPLLVPENGASFGTLFLLESLDSEQITELTDNSLTASYDFCRLVVRAEGVTEPCVRPVKPRGGTYLESTILEKSIGDFATDGVDSLNEFIGGLLIVAWNWKTGIQNGDLRTKLSESEAFGDKDEVYLIATITPNRSVVWIPLNVDDLLTDLNKIEEIFTAHQVTYLDGPNIWLGTFAA